MEGDSDTDVHRCGPSVNSSLEGSSTTSNRSDGVYLVGRVETIVVAITVDTGATKTIISDEIFYRIPETLRPELKKPAKSVTTANGGHLTVHGEGTFQMMLGNVSVSKSVLVAEIEDDVLLGADILQCDEKGAANLLLREGIMEFRGKKIALYRQRREVPAVFKVRSADHYIVPGMSEMIIEGFIENGGTGNLTLIESHPQLAEKCEVVVATGLVDQSKKPSVPLLVINPHPNPASIKQDMVVGLAETVAVEDCHSFDVPQNSSEEMKCRRANSSLQTENPLPEHLQTLYLDAATDCNESQQDQVAALLLEFAEVFSKNGEDLGLTHLTEHSIETGDSRPFKQPPHRVPAAFAGEDKKAIEKLQRQGVIRPSSSPWASPIVLVHKKDGTVRFCTDYRWLNQCTKKDAFPIPRTEDCLDAVAGASLFSTMDITSAYHQIPVRQEDIPKTAFVTKYGLFEYVTMPFGLCNATATFQRLMELALSGLQWNSCLVYLDDVIVFSQDFETHMTRLRAVLSKIQKAGMKLKPSKCNFLKKQVGFLGHVISEHGVLPNPENTKKIQDWPVPRSVKQVRSFLGLGNYYRRFVKDYSKIVKPLTNLTKKDCFFKWTDECQAAFDQLKECLVGPDIMAYPMDEGQFIVDCDACDVSIGCVLSQVQDGRERVIAYGSRTMNKSERNYCVTDKELLAVKHFVEHYKHYLLGRRFLVRSDHQALKWLFSLKDPKSRIARWIEILSAYDFEVEYRRGTQHGNADALSRCPDPKICNCPEISGLKCGPCNKCLRRESTMSGQESTVEDCRRINGDRHSSSSSEWIRWTDQPQGEWFAPYSNELIKKKQEEDKDISPVLKWKIEGRRPSSQEVCTCSPATRNYWHYWDSLLVIEGVLYKKFEKKDGSGTFTQLILPRSMMEPVLHHMHDCTLSAHLGQKKTKQKIVQHFFWYEMMEDIVLWCNRCEVCAKTKTPAKKPKAPLGKLGIGAPWDRLGIDILGPFPESEKGNRYILVVTDHFSKWVELFAVPNQSASTCADILVNEVIARFGCPYEILTDQGRNFESKIFTELCELLEIRKKRTSPANPKCNGQTERFNRTLVRMIKAYLQDQDQRWDEQLGCLAAAYRSTVNESTGLTPNLVLMGREVRLPAELMFKPKNSQLDSPSSYGEYVLELKEKMIHAREVAHQHLEAATKRQKEYYDAGQTFQQYKAGDLVWCLSQLNQLGMAPKLRNPYDGPFLVLKKMNDLNYLVQFGSRGPKRVLHYNKLKPCVVKRKPGWVRYAMNKFTRG